MVDSISGKNQGIQDAGLLGVNQQQQVEKVNADSAKESKGVQSLKQLDEATISDEARAAYARDKEVLRFGRLAQRVNEPFNQEKVQQIKDMLDSGRISEYLRSVNTDALVDSILKGPSGSFLR